MYTVNINGEEYIKKSEVATNNLAKVVDGMRFVCVRTYSAGVHCGYLKERNGKEVTLLNAIRVWQWAGACSLSELATLGSSDLANCKYTVTVPEILLTEAIEIIPMTEQAKNQMESAKRWQK